MDSLGGCEALIEAKASLFAALLNAETQQGANNKAKNAPESSSPHAGYGACGEQGLPQYMEDSYNVQEKLSPKHTPHRSMDTTNDVAGDELGEACSSVPGFPEDLAFFSVFDGHGGSDVAQHCSEHLHQHFTRELSDGVLRRMQALALGSGTGCSGPPYSSPRFSGAGVAGAAAASDGHASGDQGVVAVALRNAFAATDGELAGTDAGEFVGATAVVAVVSRHHIWLAHCGDSRAVIQRNGCDGVALTSDHKPDRADEAARIRAAGGRIVRSNGALRVMGMLAMSRSIGDHYLRPYVIAEPEVACIERGSSDEVLILATDGLWDVFSVNEAATLAARCITRSREKGLSKNGACRVASSVLANAALARGSRDNVTVIIVDIEMLGAHAGDDATGAASAVELPSGTEEAEAAPSAGPGSSVGTCLLLRADGSREVSLGGGIGIIGGGGDGGRSFAANVRLESGDLLAGARWSCGGACTAAGAATPGKRDGAYARSKSSSAQRFIKALHSVPSGGATNSLAAACPASARAGSSTGAGGRSSGSGSGGKRGKRSSGGSAAAAAATGELAGGPQPSPASAGRAPQPHSQPLCFRPAAAAPPPLAHACTDGGDDGGDVLDPPGWRTPTARAALDPVPRHSDPLPHRRPLPQGTALAATAAATAASLVVRALSADTGDEA